MHSTIYYITYHIIDYDRYYISRLRPCRRPLCLLVGGLDWGLVICSLGGAFSVFVMVFEGAGRSFLSSGWSFWRAGGSWQARWGPGSIMARFGAPKRHQDGGMLGLSWSHVVAKSEHF